MQLLGNRFYDSIIGRFISRDPIGAGDNWYAYCDNDPVDNSDPSGLDWQNGKWVPKAGSDSLANMWTDGFFAKAEQALNKVADNIENVWNQVHNADTNNGQYTYDFKLYCQFTDYVAAHPYETAGNAAAILLSLGEEVFIEETFGGLNCFSAGTPVQMADGSTKPIEQVKEGDLVLSRDQNDRADGKVVAARVVRTKQHAHPSSQMVVVTLSSGEKTERIVCTDNHPFYVPGAGWTPAGRLALGTQITPRAGPRHATIMGQVTVTAVEPLASTAGTTTVYNFEVEGTHTYFVGNGNGGTWVHNDCFGTIGDLENSLNNDVYFHYTDDDGLNGIMQNGMISPGMKGRVQVTQRMLSPAEAEQHLFIGATTHAGRGKNIIALKMDPSSLIEGKPGELIHSGTIRFGRHGDVIYAGPNPF